MSANPTDSLPTRLRELRARLGAVVGVSAGEVQGPAPETLDAIIERLDRDLLPRTAGAHEHLVVGIVGPNNAGKSALFNALLAGRARPGEAAPATVSPSLPTGGATRRLVGAVHPALRAALESEPTLQRFPMRGVTPGVDGVERATLTAAADEAAELLLVETTDVPESLLLVDTPDFDSVLRENRAVTDALLCVADVAVVVVTRHTYQNHDVIEFLRAWLDHGRPWVLVYNESIDGLVTSKHAEKIASDLGGEPEAVFHAGFEVEVARGNQALVPLALTPEGETQGLSLSTWLGELGSRRDLKARALEASLAALRADLAKAAAESRALTDAVDQWLDAPARRAQSIGMAVAREAMPMGPFLEAFREVLDERPTLVQRELRRGLRWTGDQLVGGARWVRGKLGSGGNGPENPEEAARTTLLDVERAELGKRWTTFFEPAILELRARMRDNDVPAEVRDLLAGWTPTQSDTLARAGEVLALDPELMGEYRSACRDIITAELDQRGSEWFLQIAVDAIHLVPLGVAGAWIVHTGGLGADVAVAGGGAAAAALAERLSRTLGTGVAMAARKRWAELRSVRIGDAALLGLLGDEGRMLESVRNGARGLAETLTEWSAETDWRGLAEEARRAGLRGTQSGGEHPRGEEGTRAEE